MAIQVVVDDTHVAKRDDGKYVLTISSRIGKFELELTDKAWRELGETAQWFEKRLAKGEL